MKLTLRIPISTFASFIFCVNFACATELERIASAFSKGDFAGVIQAYEHLALTDRNKSMPLYWNGFSYMRRHDYLQAKNYLLKAIAGDLPAEQKETSNKLLGRIQTIEQLCPPLYKTYQSGGFSINLHVQETEWSRNIAAQMPRFLERAQEAFGTESAEINFYLFDQRLPYDAFFDAWMGTTPGATKHRGTGVMHMVEFCRYFPNGSQIGASNPNDLYFRILHEYSHALCNTIYGDFFQKDCPQWLNESMADYFGWKYLPERYGQQSQEMRRFAAKNPPPSYDVISHRLYEQSGGYLVPDVLFLELMKDKDISCFKQILETAKSHNGDFELALRQVSGKDPRQVYQDIIHTYW